MQIQVRAQCPWHIRALEELFDYTLTMRLYSGAFECAFDDHQK